MLHVVYSPHGVHQIGKRADISHIYGECQLALQLVQVRQLLRGRRVPDVPGVLVKDDPVQTAGHLRVVHIRERCDGFCQHIVVVSGGRAGIVSAGHTRT